MTAASEVNQCQYEPYNLCLCSLVFIGLTTSKVHPQIIFWLRFSVFFAGLRCLYVARAQLDEGLLDVFEKRQRRLPFSGCVEHE